MTNRQRGITLIEMLVVVTIIGLFAALVGPPMLRRVDESRVTLARTQITLFENALGAYKLDTGTFPTTEQGLEALRTRGYLTKEVPLDPWKHPYVYKYPGEHGDGPDIICAGADGRADIVSWSNR
jgi:general secretion pathway protein G